jgi:hypothetical protein
MKNEVPDNLKAARLEAEEARLEVERLKQVILKMRQQRNAAAEILCKAYNETDTKHWRHGNSVVFNLVDKIDDAMIALRTRFQFTGNLI